MKKIVLTISLVTILSTVLMQAQNTNRGLTPSLFKKVLNQQFASLITGQSKNSIGNFASLDLKESEVAFAGNTITKRGHIFGIIASGGVSDGLFTIFKNSTLNTKISLETQFNFLNLSNQSLTWYDDSYQAYRKKIADIEEKYRIKKIETENQYELHKLNLKKAKLIKTLNDLRERLRAESVDLIKDSINYAIDLNNSELVITDSLINFYPPVTIAMEDMNNARAIELKKLNPELELYGFRFGWFSLKYKIQNNSFRLFNPSATYQNQVTDSSFISNEVKFQYSFYNWTKEKYKTYFYCIGLSLALSDNLGQLSRREINEVSNYGPNVNDRTITKKYNVYTGKYINNLKQARIYADYYHFLFDNNIAALHIYPECTFRTSNKPLYNLGFGFLFAFKDAKKDDKSVLNAELFYNFIDLAKNTDTELSLLERNNIGIRFAFPINFINK